MRTPRSHLPARSLVPFASLRAGVAAAAALLAACADGTTTAPPSKMIPPPPLAMAEGAEYYTTLAQMRQATVRYHDLGAAIADGFVKLHDCEILPGEGAIGMVYFRPDRIDMVIDAAAPEALIYEPSASGDPALVAVEFAVPNLGQGAPTFLGATFQPEDEVGVFALHAWVWRHNPEGMFAEANPRVTCGGLVEGD